jgi:tRNA pseudouridine38-40 synthase
MRARKRRIKLVIAYDGTNYCGWQIQPNGITIEEVLNKAISKLTGEMITIIGASRTDSGVHALGNVAVFDTESNIAAEKFAFAINGQLPNDIVVQRSEEVSLDWHPRYQNEIYKTYEYRIYNNKVANPLKSRYSTFVSFDLDVQKMREGASYIIGEHDFASFCNIKTNAKTSVRTVTELSIIEIKNSRDNNKEKIIDSNAEYIEKNIKEIVIRITGNGFLYNMVRIIAGTLIRVGRGFYEPRQVQDIIEMKLRTEAGVTAPAEGLTLVNIDYHTDKD